MKKVAIVKKQLGKLGYKLNRYEKTGKIERMFFEGGITKDSNNRMLEIYLNWNRRTIVYSPEGFLNFKSIYSLKDLKPTVYKVEINILEHRKKLIDLRKEFIEEEKD